MMQSVGNFPEPTGGGSTSSVNNRKASSLMEKKIFSWIVLVMRLFLRMYSEKSHVEVEYGES